MQKNKPTQRKLIDDLSLYSNLFRKRKFVLAHIDINYEENNKMFSVWLQVKQCPVVESKLRKIFFCVS